MYCASLRRTALASRKSTFIRSLSSLDRECLPQQANKYSTEKLVRGEISCRQLPALQRPERCPLNPVGFCRPLPLLLEHKLKRKDRRIRRRRPCPRLRHLAQAMRPGRRQQLRRGDRREDVAVHAAVRILLERFQRGVRHDLRR